MKTDIEKYLTKPRWNRCFYCGKFMAYLRPATRTGKRKKIIQWHFDSSFADPLSGNDGDYYCHECHKKYKRKK